MSDRTQDLRRIEEALIAASKLAKSCPWKQAGVEFKSGDDPVTLADRELNELLLSALPQSGDGWLSEETADDPARLQAKRVWIVDPLDGTREFVQAIPEWCISVALVEDGIAVAGGIANPLTNELILGSLENGITVNGVPGPVKRDSSDRVVLASRSEVKRGEWSGAAKAPFALTPMGSVAYKMARVAAGLADATWTFVPKHEWDVAAGAVLVAASGGEVMTLDGLPPVFNRPDPLLDGLIAFGATVDEEIKDWCLSGRPVSVQAQRGPEPAAFEVR